MGCSQSTIEGKEAVNQCKERKVFMKQSISASSAFAAAHFAYASALKSTGAALSDYAGEEIQFLRRPPHRVYSDFKPHSKTIVEEVNGDGEVVDHGLKRRSSYKSSVSRSSDGSRVRVKDFSRGSRSRRGNSKRENVPRPPSPPGNDGIVPWDFFFTSTVDDVLGPILSEVDDKSTRTGKPEIQKTITDDQSEYGGGGEIRSGGCRRRAVVEREEESPLSSMKHVQNMNLLQVITELEDGFVKASESAHQVTKILEANRLHYHSNSTRVKQVFIWNRSCKGLKIANDVKDNYAHSTILEKMLALEKKLYDEIKAGQEMKYVYQKKVDSLNKLTKRGVSSDSLVQTKAMVSDLKARCIVKMESIDSIISEINRLRDEQLYKKLVQLLEEMGEMWENMRKQHENQLKNVEALSVIKISQSSNEISEYHLSNTKQLHVHVKMWCSEFQKLILHQNEYIKSLNNWLNLNLISTDNNLRDKVSSPQKHQNPKIHLLLRTWQDQLEKLPEEGAKTAIDTFADVIDRIVRYQSDEMQMKERCEETRRELTRKSRKFEEWCDKHIAKTTPTDENDPDVQDDIEMIAEHQIAVEALKRKLEEEEEAYRRQCVQVKDMSLIDLKMGLLEVFTAMSEFSCACSQMYGSLKSHSMPMGRYSNRIS